MEHRKVFGMPTGLKIAIGGKGGVGKTTVSAVWATIFAQDGLDVLAIDADPDTNLCCAFGISADKTPEPLISIKKLISERTGTGKDAAVTAYMAGMLGVATLSDLNQILIAVGERLDSLACPIRKNNTAKSKRCVSHSIRITIYRLDEHYQRKTEDQADGIEMALAREP